MPTAAKNSALGWVSVRHLRHFIARGEAAGLDMDAVLGEAGLGRAQLADADGAIPVAAIETMLAAISRRYPDQPIGLHLARDIQPATFGAIGYALQACATIADVIELAGRYSGLLSNIGRFSIQRAPGSVQLCWECAVGGAALKRQATEYVLGAVVTLMRLLPAEQRNLVRSVQFSHAPPRDPARMRDYFVFFRCPVYFDRPESSVTLPSAALATKLRHGDAFIRELLEGHARELLRQREQQTSLTDEVAQLIHSMMIDGTPSRDAVAAQLGISDRSLHRKLHEQGTSYREILDRVRLDLAQHRLRDSADPVRRIAEDLGFATHQAFLRWFKQTTGQSPGSYRASAPES